MTVTVYYLSPVLAAFRKCRPDVEINLFPGHHDNAVEQLLTYRADVALVASDVKTSGLRQTVLFADPLVLINTPGSMPAGTPAAVAELEDATLLALPPQSGHWVEIDGALARRKIRYGPRPKT